MNLIMLLWPHANARYRAESARLACAEAQVLLSHIEPDARASVGDHLGFPCLRLFLPDGPNEAALRALSGHSLMFGLYFCRDDGALEPLSGRMPAAVGEDLSGILKYKGKTNERFTALMIDVALATSSFSPDERLSLLDPMCGRGTTLFEGVNRGLDCTGSDMDRQDLAEAERFLKRYLEYHRMRHARTETSLTLPEKRSAPLVRFDIRDGRAHIALCPLDARDVRAAFGKRRFHLIVTDLPYGVQHGSKGLEGLLEQALPAWRACLKPGGAAAVSFNAQTLPAESVRAHFREAGFTVCEGGPYDRFSHWVEQAVTRDLVVAVA